MINVPKLFPGSGVVPDRQERSHPQGVFFYKNLFFYIADLGADKIWHYMVTIVANISFFVVLALH